MNNILWSKIYREKTIKALEHKKEMLGFNNNEKVINFLNLRLLSSIFLFLVIAFVLPYGIFLAPVSVFIYYYLLEYISFDLKIKERETRLNNEAINFFAILNIALEEKMNLLEALIKTTNCVKGELTEEFLKVIKDVQKGKSMAEALDELQRRIPYGNVRNIIFKLKELNEKGISINNSIQIEIDSLKKQEYLKAKLNASIMPLKILLLSLIFGSILIILIIFAPNILDMIK